MPLSFTLGPLAVSGFASGWMLLWTAAAAIPIILHLLNRKQQRVAPWAAMQLLRQVIEQESRRLRIEQLLLLLLRTLIPIVLAIALARPFFNVTDAQGIPESELPRLWIVAIDASASMGYQPQDVSRFELAKQQALDLIASTNTGDAYALVQLANPSRAIISRPTFDKSSMLSELRRLELFDTALNLSSGLQWIESIAAEVELSSTLPQDIHVAIYSDLGRNSWLAAVDGDAAVPLKRLQEAASLSIHSVAEGPVANVAVTSLQPSQSHVVVGSQVDMVIELENFADAPVSQLPVQLKANGQTMASTYIDLQPFQRYAVHLSTTLSIAGPAVIEASIPADRLVSDDTRSCVLEVVEQERILVVVPSASQGRDADARTVPLALRPPQTRSDERGGPRQTLAVMSQLELRTADLTNWNAVVLVDLPGLTRSEQLRLDSFAAAGGGVVLLMGRNANPSAWNVSSADGLPLSGFQLIEPSTEELWELDPLDYQSPILQPFQAFPDAGLLSTPIFRFWKIDRSLQTGNEAANRDSEGTTNLENAIERAPLAVDLATTSGQPLITRRRVGAGWVVSLLSAPQSGAARGLFASTDNSTSANATWNAMATWPSFVPLMQQMVIASLEHDFEDKNIFAGQAIRGTTRRTAEAPQVSVQRPDGTQETLAVGQADAQGELKWRFPRTQHRGVYLVRSGAGQEQPYAVNIDPAESALQSLNPSQLPQSARKLAGDAPDTLARKLAVESARPLVSAAQADRISQVLLYGLVALLIAESTLAWWFGRRVA
ncbi:BatA domain-containing protein [Aureliella helgolandensis]|uniref:VWFA domain-containing protein n=1 Tax=Aureliella helgolandensis TaxID=2527968 RepID=A0A518GHM2_9BACT|nr:BatA domain-containing protein [Aureliella helgolandensis]QDV28084.1 hypothetical protein Q31a_64770 [Aureliella helgolandensis]